MKKNPVIQTLLACAAALPLLHSPIAVAQTESCSGGALFAESFADNSKGWTLGPEWQIGPATTSTGQSFGNPDPGLDTTPTADKGVAGIQIGGNASTALHPPHYLESPAIDTEVAGTVTLAFKRWLNSDHSPYMVNSIQVFNGNDYITIFQTGGTPGVSDSAWMFQQFDVTAHKNSSFRVRFGLAVGSGGAFNVSSWNLDDLVIGCAGTDVDADAVGALFDNCPAAANADQADADGDGVGNACDTFSDTDADGTEDGADNCPTVSNADQQDSDADGIGDVCDPTPNDADADGVDDAQDNCPDAANSDQLDTDGDGIGDACDALTDADGDGIGDGADNCLGIANPEQADADQNGIGDACESAACTTGTLLAESFANNSKGWILGPEWQIGPATVSVGHASGNPDPGVDTSPTPDNGVAGIQIGANASIALHPPHYLESPPIDTAVAGPVTLEFNRWLNSDSAPFMTNTVEVFNGSTYVTLFQTGGSPGVTDNAWTAQQFDVTAHKNAKFRIRFGLAVTSAGAFKVSSWNVDDVVVACVADPSRKPSFSIDNSLIAYGTQTVGTTSAIRTVAITNTGSVRLSNITAIIGGDHASDIALTESRCTAGLAPGESCAMDFAFTPGDGGARSATATLTATDETSAVAAVPQLVSITGTGTQAHLTVAPGTLDFGSKAYGTESAPGSIRLSNSGDDALSVLGIGSNDGQFTHSGACATTLAPGEHCDVMVRFHPLAVGPAAGALTISSNSPGSPQVVSLSGTGIQRATQLTAGAEAATIARMPLSARNTTPFAILSASNPREPLSGKLISFTGKKFTCKAMTDTQGVAKCSGTYGGVAQGYTASFAGDANYLGASSTVSKP